MFSDDGTRKNLPTQRKEKQACKKLKADKTALEPENTVNEVLTFLSNSDILSVIDRAEIFGKRATAYKNAFDAISEKLQLYIGYKGSGKDYNDYANSIREILLENIVIAPIIIKKIDESTVSALHKWKSAKNIYENALRDYYFASNDIGVPDFEFIVIKLISAFAKEGTPSNEMIREILETGGLYVRFYTELDYPSKHELEFQRVEPNLPNTPRLPAFYTKGLDDNMEYYHPVRGREPKDEI